MRLLKALLPVVIIGVSVFIAKGIMDNPPEAKPRPAIPDRPIPVEAISLEAEDFRIEIDTYGTVQPSTETAIIPQVAGKIIEVSPDFENGGFVKQGDIILQIDPADYRIAVKTAEAALAQARATLSEQTALSQEAIRDWKRLGRKGEPGNLVARKPQLSAARAQVASAQAQLEKARLDLERSSIRAPYDGRIKNKQANIGQYVSPGSLLTELYATNAVQLRLPLSQQDLQYLDIPDQANRPGSPIEFTADNGSGQPLLTGYISRSEGLLDDRTRQLFVTARIDAPFENTTPIVIGQFLQARILGQIFDGVFTLPTALIRDGDFVILAEDGELKQQAVSIMWQNERISVIDQGLKAGDLLVTTPLGDDAAGLKVRVSVLERESEVNQPADRLELRQKPTNETLQ